MPYSSPYFPEESAVGCGVLLGGVVHCIAPAPVIADFIGRDRAVLVAGTAWDGVRALQHGFQRLLAAYACLKDRRWAVNIRSIHHSSTTARDTLLRAK